jgi:hypothetical protein
MNRETMQQIITEDLEMRKVSTKMVPWILTEDQKQHRPHISIDLIHNEEMFESQKQNARACNGKHKIHLDRRKHACLACS